MKEAIRKRSKDFAAVALLFLVAVGVGGYILGHQRLNLPGWVPVVGTSFYEVKGEFSTAQAVTPGQGQSVNVAGVQVGEVAGVDLKDGRAIVTMNLKKQYEPIYRDAHMLLRPKTNLKDMTVELDPGTKSAGALPNGGTIPIQNTLPDINSDEILAGLDGDTRAYLQLLVQGGAQGLEDNGDNLSAVFRRFSPTSRDIGRVTKLVAERRAHLKRVIHNFGLLTQAIGEKDGQIAQFVESSRQVFETFAQQDANLRDALREFPGALKATNEGLEKADRFARALGPATEALRPGVRALAPSLEQSRTFLRDSIAPVRDQIVPFAHEALPIVTRLRPAAKHLADMSPDLASSVKVINRIFNELAYNPPGEQEGYLFYLAWANHLANAMFSLADGTGPIRRGQLLVGCSSLSVLRSLAVGGPGSPPNKIVQTLIGLTNTPVSNSACGSEDVG